MTGPGGGYDPSREILSSEDIANAIYYAVSQPERVTICELLIRPLKQDR